MTKGLYVFLIILILACSGNDSDGETIPEMINQSPSIPMLTYPSQYLLCVENNLTFTWNIAADADGDAINYQIQIAEDDSFNIIINDLKSTETSSKLILDKGQTYYWRVRAIDNKGNASPFSSSWKFYTQSDPTTNNIPMIPAALSPDNGDIVIEDVISLVWNSSDLDGDVLTYDLYFSEASDPSLLVEDYDESSYSVALKANSVYTWKIIVKDNNGGIAIGPIWHFSTP